MSNLSNILNKVRTNTLFKTNSIQITKRYFESATTGATFNYPREISPFLTQPSKVSKLNYYVKRTKFLSLPVYSEFKNGNTRKLTIIRRIQGDVKSLKEDLLKDFSDWEVAISSINQQIIIKGQKAHQVRDWLTKKGF